MSNLFLKQKKNSRRNIKLLSLGINKKKKKSVNKTIKSKKKRL